MLTFRDKINWLQINANNPPLYDFNLVRQMSANIDSKIRTGNRRYIIFITQKSLYDKALGGMIEIIRLFLKYADFSEYIFLDWNQRSISKL